MSSKYLIVCVGAAFVLTIPYTSWAQTSDQSAAASNQLGSDSNLSLRPDWQTRPRNRMRDFQNPQMPQQTAPALSPYATLPPYGHSTPWTHDRLNCTAPNQFVPPMYPRFTPHMDRRNSTRSQAPRQSLGMMHGSVNLDRIKSMLSINSAQEPVWNKTTKTLQESITTIRKSREAIDRETVKKMNSAERFAFITKQRQQIQKPIDAIQSAIDELNGVLDPAQKNRARHLLPNLDNLSSLLNPERDVNTHQNHRSPHSGSRR